MVPQTWTHLFTAGVCLWSLSISSGHGWQLATYRAVTALAVLLQLVPVLLALGVL